MNKILNIILLSILLIGFSTRTFAAEVYLNHIKEPKIILSEPELEPKKETIIKEIPKEVEVKKEAETVKEPIKLIEKTHETPMIDFTNEELEKKANLEILKKQKQDIKAEEPKITITKTNEKSSKNETIAIVFASNTIGKYSIEATNVAMTYLVNKNLKFTLNVFDIEAETKENIAKALDTLSEKGIKKVIFLLTNNGMWGLNSYPEIGKFDIYLPLVNKLTVANPKPNYIFGGMDYTKQFKFLSSKASSNIVEIYDESGISKSLHDELVKLNIPNIKYIQLVGKNPNYNPLFLKSNKIKDSTVILNTSIIRSAIVLSLLRGNNVEPKETFATQLNYSPLIFNLTQGEDRDNLFVTNSIDLLPRDLEELISFFGDDVVFSWVNYSTILGLEYFMTNNKKLFGNIEIKENQINYPVKLFGFEGTKFVDTKR